MPNHRLVITRGVRQIFFEYIERVDKLLVSHGLNNLLLTRFAVAWECDQSKLEPITTPQKESQLSIGNNFKYFGLN